jgi:HEAT repeat protein/S1-C subfamily serine protease/DNA-directed RNA polymerase subunit RPC12/RpoP
VIVFNCRKCNAELEAPNDQAGAKTTCPDCGLRMLVPEPAPSKKAVTAKPPRPKAAPPSKGAPAKAGPAKAAAPTKRPRRGEEEDDEDEKETKGSSKTLWILVGGGAVVAAAVVGLILVLNNKQDDKPQVASNNQNTPQPRPQPQPTPQPVPVQPDTPNKEPEKPPEKPPETDPLAVPVMAAGGPVSANDVYQYSLKSVVWIWVGVEVESQPNAVALAGQGSGSLVDRKNRLILTNYHVVQGGKRFLVFFPRKEGGTLVASKEAYLKGSLGVSIGTVFEVDQRRDMALIQLDKVPEGFEAITLGKKGVQVGQKVYSVGSPGGSDGLWLLTTGDVRQVYHKKWKASGGEGTPVLDLEADIVETSSPTNPGDSGGPLMNEQGEQVGVTHGGSRTSNALSIFINASEATDFLQKSYQKHGLAWPPETRPLLATKASGAAAASQVPALIRALTGHKDPAERARAAQILGEIGPEARLAVPELIKALNDPSDLLRRSAAEALAKTGPPNKQDLALLRQTLKAKTLEGRLYAAAALGNLGADARPAAPDLLEALKEADADTNVRQAAARALGKIDAREQAQPGLQAALDDADKEVRVAAGEALAALCLASGGNVPGLLGMLKHKDGEVRAHAARALAKLGRDAKPALADLIKAVKEDKDKQVLKAALETLAQIGADAKASLPEVKKALRDTDPDVRRAAIDALGRLGAEPKEVLDDLKEALADVNLRKNAAQALGKIGTAARPAVPALAEALQDRRKEVRMEVLAALIAVKPTTQSAAKTVKPLVELLEDKDDEVQNKAIEALAKTGKPAVSELDRALRDSNERVRLGAVTALGVLGTDAKAAYRDLVILQQTDPSKAVRDAAGKALNRIVK